MLRECLLQRKCCHPAMSWTCWGDMGVVVESSEGFVFKDLALSPPRQRCREEKGEGTERERKKKILVVVLMPAMRFLT